MVKSNFLGSNRLTLFLVVSLSVLVTVFVNEIGLI
ncbi:MAG: hypothetical protein K0S93_60 [Nitrososphaeraceae archaeon]|jgi:hypothetical protein|nr:hypothetical protein [Nitrososphaeraceae archaeon]